MKKENFIRNGDFADGKLEPWLTDGKGVAVFEEAGRHYVRIPATANIHQNPNPPTGPSVLQFQARTREPLDVDQSIFFTAILLFDLPDGSFYIDPHGGYVSSPEWQTFSFKVPELSATGALLQITPLGATEGRVLTKVKSTPIGTIEIKLISLYAAE